MRNPGHKDRRDMVTGVQRESFCGRDMVTGAAKQIGNRRDLVTGVQREGFCGRDMVTGATKQIGNRRDMVTGVQREGFCGRDMVTGATKQIGNRRDMVTGVHEEVTYCSPSTSSGKRKKEPFYQSTAIPQREYPCDDRGRPNFVGPPTVGK